MQTFQILPLLLFGIFSASQTLARPSYLPPYISEISPVNTLARIEYTPTLVGHELHSIPTAVSHQSQTIVHEKRPFLRPIIEHKPILRSYTTPILKSYIAPTSARVVLHPEGYAATPIAQTYGPSFRSTPRVRPVSISSWPLSYDASIQPVWNVETFEAPAVYEYKNNVNGWPLKK